MALEMISGDLKAEIAHDEEFIFSLAQRDPARYPGLVALWSAYYDDPRVSAQRAGDIVHELIELLDANGGGTNKRLLNLVVRLLPFFSRAHRVGREIRCISD